MSDFQEAPNATQLECYSVFQNADDSLLFLNPILNGCKFQVVRLPALEASFGSLFGLPKTYSVSCNIENDSGDKFSMEFSNAISASDFAGMETANRGYLMFLQSNEISVQTRKNNVVSMDFEAITRLQSEAAHIEQCLRLTGRGDIAATLTFLYDPKNRFVGCRHFRRGLRHRFKDFSISEGEVSVFERLYRVRLVAQWEFSLAMEQFHNSYTIDHQPTRFIALITVLESIFNVGRDQIAHTIARHLSLIISKTEPEFHDNYAAIKKLYGKRSALVHGLISTIDKAEVQLAEDWARAALIYCMENRLGRNDLFKRMNSMGLHEGSA